ncbi:MAG: hypothetical protein ACI4MG_04805 [Aristaeellaceae bacterium]
MKKIAVVLVAVLLMTTLFSCAAAENAQPYFSHVLVITSGLDLSGNVAYCMGAGTSKFDDTYTEVYVTLQKCPLSGLQLWSLEGMWSATSSGVVAAALEKYVVVEPGYKYRVYTHVRIKDADGNILESVGLYSRTLSYAAE